MNSLSTAYGLTQTTYGIGNMVGPALVGLAHDYFENYLIPFCLVGACFSVGAVSCFVTSKLHFG